MKIASILENQNAEKCRLQYSQKEDSQSTF